MHELVKNCYKKLNTFTYLDDINESSKIDKSGIYMITLDNVHSETLVPIYIGQSTNMQKRFKAHLKRLMALNRLRYQEYYNYFFNYKYRQGMSFYEGKFLYCKLFHTMLAHKCSLNDVKMVVVEYCEPEKLEERELYYINYFSSQFLGFNQFHARTLGPQKESRPEFYLQEVWSEYQQLPVFLEHDLGYTRFNYYTVYYGISTHYQQLTERYLPGYMDFKLTKDLDNTYGQSYRELSEAIENLYIDDRIIKRQKSKLLDLTRKRHALRYQLIFPQEKYQKFPLGHRKLINPRSVTELPNSLQLHFFTNKLGQDNYLLGTYIVSIKAIFRDKNYSIFEKTYVIESSLTRAIQEGIVYEEKYVLNKPNTLFSRPEPFKPIVKDADYLTLGIEQLTGLNDSCIVNTPLISLEKVFSEFETLVDSNTMIAFTTPPGISLTLFLEGFDNTISKTYPELYNHYVEEEGKRQSSKLPEQELRRTLLGNSYLFLQDNYQNSKKPLLYNKPKPVKLSKEKTNKTKSPQEKAERELENQIKRQERYCNRLKNLTTSITVLNYQDSKTPVSYRCEHCSFEWSSRSDKILAKPVCRNCKR